MGAPKTGPMKVILTLVVVGVLVWFMWPGLRRVIRDFSSPRQDAPGAPPQQKTAQNIEADDLVKCVTCGTYVAVLSPVACERDDCPAR